MTRDDDFAADSQATTPPKPSALRFSLYTLMSATAVFAVWMAYYLTVQETQRMESQLPSLRNLARELYVEDPTWYAAVRPHELSDDDFRWRVYLPPGGKYQLCLADKNFNAYSNPKREKPAPSIVAPIESGEHAVSLAYEKAGEEWTIQVNVDGQVIMQETQPADWNLGIGSVGGSDISNTRQFSTDAPMDLFDRVFNIRDDPDNPYSSSPRNSETGLRLWVEKLEK